jgi:hypothetical protein
VQWIAGTQRGSAWSWRSADTNTSTPLSPRQSPPRHWVMQKRNQLSCWWETENQQVIGQRQDKAPGGWSDEQVLSLGHRGDGGTWSWDLFLSPLLDCRPLFHATGSCENKKSGCHWTRTKQSTCWSVNQALVEWRPLFHCQFHDKNAKVARKTRRITQIGPRSANKKAKK